MKSRILGLAAIGLAMLAAPASATQLFASVTGTLTAQKNESGFNNTGVDDHLSVGTEITLTTSFDSSLILPWGSTGYSVVGLYQLPTTGDSFFRIDAAGLTWAASASDVDGAPVYRDDVNHFYVSVPALILQGDKIVGVAGFLAPHSGEPQLLLGSHIVPGSTPDFFNILSVSSAFSIDAANGEYGNRYNSPGFSGVWDFANSTVMDAALGGVPEPATWGLLIAGFALVGGAMRRRSLRPALHV